MKDKEFLERIEIAYKIWKESNNNNEVKEFIDWLYKQYGYVKDRTLK